MVKDPEQVWKLLMREPGEPELLRRRRAGGGARREVSGRTPPMNKPRQSDGRIVPENAPNKTDETEAEAWEGRRPAKRNAQQDPMSQTQSWNQDMNAVLERIRQAVRRNRKEKLTAFYHHVYHLDHLRAAYFQLQRRAAAGVDGETWQTCGQDLEVRLTDLSERLRRGAYRALPVRLVNIPKPDGHQRPLGIPALEDKIAQSVTAQIGSVIREE